MQFLPYQYAPVAQQEGHLVSTQISAGSSPARSVEQTASVV